MKPEFFLGLGVPLAFIAGIWVMLQYPKAKVVVADILRLLGFLGKWAKRTSLKAELEGSVNAFSRLFNSDFDTPLLPECKVEWVTSQNYEHLLQPGKAIVRLAFPKSEHDLCFYNAACAYVQTAFLAQAKPFLRKATSKAIDFLMVKTLLRNARRTSITIFNDRFSEQETLVKETFAKLEEADERGLFRQLFVQELHFFGETLGLKSPLAKYEQETETFLRWFYDLATREEKEQSSLSFFSENFRIGVILVADSETYAKYGPRAYIKRANQYAANKCQTIYVLSRGQSRGDIAEDIVSKLVFSGGFRKLSKRTRTLKFDPRGPVLVTSYSLKPDLARIETAAWTALQSDFDHNQQVTGTIEIVTSKSVRVDVYGLKIDIGLEQLSKLALNEARSLFKEDQTLRLRIIQLDRSQGLVALSNVDTDTDPQRLCEELGQIGGQIQEGTIARVLRDKESQFEFAVVVQFVHRDLNLDCFIPRQAATFTRYAPLSLRYQPEQKVNFILERFDAEHSQYVGRIAGLSDPWEEIGRYTIGQSVPCTVRKITEYYVNCELQEGLEGAIYFDELSWGSTEENEKLIRSLTVGKTIEAAILSIDKERRIISLSVKRLTKSDCEMFSLAFIDKIVRATVSSVQPSRAYVEFQGGSGRGLLPKWETFHSGDLRRSISRGDALDVRLLEYDYRMDTILVSVKRVICDEFKKTAAALKQDEIVMAEVVGVSQDRVNVIIRLDPHKLHGYIHKSEVSSIFFCDDQLLQKLFKPNDFYQCTVKYIDEFNQVVELSRKGFFRTSKENLDYGCPYTVFLFKTRSQWFGYSEQLEGVLIDKSPQKGISEGVHEVMIASIRGAVELTMDGL